MGTSLPVAGIVVGVLFAFAWAGCVLYSLITRKKEQAKVAPARVVIGRDDINDNVMFVGTAPVTPQMERWNRTAETTAEQGQTTHVVTRDGTRTLTVLSNMGAQSSIPATRQGTSRQQERRETRQETFERNLK